MNGKNVSFIKWMINISLISIVSVGIFLSVVSAIFISVRTNTDYKEIAKATSINVTHTLDALSSEDYTYDEETGILKKGDIIITDEAFKLSQKDNANIHHTIFWGDTRVLTDVKDDKGNSVVGTKLTDSKIINTVSKEGLYTANNVKIYGSSYTVCYYPLKNGSTIVGYVFTGVNQEEATSVIVSNTIIMVVIAVALAAAIMFFVVRLVNQKSHVFEEKLSSVSATAMEQKNVVSMQGLETNKNMEQINEAISQMSTAVMQQASHTEEIMGTMETFGNNLDAIMNHVKDTSDITQSSTSLMDELNSELLSLEEATKANSDEIVNITKQIEEDNEAVESIGQIVKVINDIAFQITLLSFNASVEAARAGEAGRGFAVVAESIKDLSDKTQSSIEDIANIIEVINEKMRFTGEASKQLMKKNDEMVEALVATKDRLGSVTKAFDKITVNISTVEEESSSILVAKNQVVQTVSSLAAASHENAAMGEEISATTDKVIETTESLINQIENLAVITETIDSVKKDFI